MTYRVTFACGTWWIDVRMPVGDYLSLACQHETAAKAHAVAREFGLTLSEFI